MYYTLFILFVAKCTVNGAVGGLSGCIAINGHSVCFYKTYLNDLNMTYYYITTYFSVIYKTNQLTKCRSSVLKYSTRTMIQ